MACPRTTSEHASPRTKYVGRSIGHYSYDKIADHSGGYFSTARELGGIQSVT
jgi:hypothetical protein